MIPIPAAVKLIVFPNPYPIGVGLGPLSDLELKKFDCERESGILDAELFRF